MGSVQAPIIVFNHVDKTVTTIATGPAADKLLSAQRKQVATSGRPAA
jgi:hypothetical protein